MVKSQNTQIQLPYKILLELNGDKQVDLENKRKSTQKVTLIGKRKASRQLKKQEAKQRKQAHYHNHHPSDTLPTIVDAKPDTVKVPLKKPVPKPTVISKAPVIKKVVPVETSDDRAMKMYAKKLKLKDTRAIGNQFKSDGLDFLLDDLPEEFGNAEDSTSTDTDEEFEEDNESSLESDSSSDQEEDETSASSSSEISSGSDMESIKESLAVEPTTKYVPPHLRKQQESQTDEKQMQVLRRSLQGHLNKLSANNIESIFSQITLSASTYPRNSLTQVLGTLIVESVGDQSHLLDSFVIVHAVLVALCFNTLGSDVGASMVQKVVEKLQVDYSQSLTVKASDETEITSRTAMNLVVLLSYLYVFHVISHKLIMDVLMKSIEHLSELDTEIVLKIIRVAGMQIRSDSPDSLKAFIQALSTRVQELRTQQQEESRGMRFKFMLEQVDALKNNKGTLSTKNAKQQPGHSLDVCESMKYFLRQYLNKCDVNPAEPLGCSLDDINSVSTKGKWWVVGAAWKGRQNNDLSLEPLNTPSLNSDAHSQLLVMAKKLKLNTDIRKSIFVVLMSSADYIDAFGKLTQLGLKDKQEREIIRMLLFCCVQEIEYNPYYALVAERLCRSTHHHKITLQFTLWDFFKTLQSGSEQISIRRVSHTARFYAELVIKHVVPISILKALDLTSVMANVPTSDMQSTDDLLVLFLQYFMIRILMEPKKDSELTSIFHRVHAARQSKATEDNDSFGDASVVLAKCLSLFLLQAIRKRCLVDDSEVCAFVSTFPESDHDDLMDSLTSRITVARHALVAPP